MRWLLARSTAPLLSSKTVELTDVEMLWGTSRFPASSNTSERIGISVRMALLRLLYSDSKVDSEISVCKNERQTKGIPPRKMM